MPFTVDISSFSYKSDISGGSARIEKVITQDVRGKRYMTTGTRYETQKKWKRTKNTREFIKVGQDKIDKLR